MIKVLENDLSIKIYKTSYVCFNKFNRSWFQMTKKSPEVNIVIPAYNTQDYICKCIDSILVQSYPNIKILIIDDASTKSMGNVIKSYDQSKIIFKRLHKNLGPGGARNEGLDLATGKYLMFCDSDDWLDINYIKNSVKYMERSNADIGMTSLKREYDDNDNIIYKCKYTEFFKINGDIALKCVTNQYDIGIVVIPPVTNKIYKLAFLKKNNLDFLEGTLYEDLLFCVKSFLYADTIIGIPNVVYHHYKRADSIVQSFTNKHIDDFGIIFQEIRNFLQDNNFYQTYMFNYYKFLERYYNLVIRQIFEFNQSETVKKEYLQYSFKKIKELIVFDEYMEYSTAEQLRKHIQPHITDTTIY